MSNKSIPPTAAPAIAAQTVVPGQGKFVRFLKDVVAGTCGGIVVTVVGHPFDTVKILLQTSKVYSGMIDAMRRTVTQHGFFGLYRGVSSPLCGQMFFRAVLFSAYGQAKQYLGADSEHPWRYAWAGAFAWSFASIIECPMDLFKVQLQMEIVRSRALTNYTPLYTGLLDVAKATIGKGKVVGEKTRGPYQGFLATLFRNTPSAFVYFGTYEYFVVQWGKYNGNGKATFAQLMAAGSFAGVLFWVPTYPLDVVKGAYQADSIYESQRKYRGWLHCFQSLYREGGIPRLYRGLTPCVVRALPANACMLTTVSVMRTYLGLV